MTDKLKNILSLGFAQRTEGSLTCQKALLSEHHQDLSFQKKGID